MFERERLPKHVKRCFNGTGQVHYAVYTWDPKAPETKTRSPYSCASWRCPGTCARHEASVTFARLKQALEREGYAPSGWCVFVLTIDRNGWYSKDPWKSADEAYRELGAMTGDFLLALRREHKRRGWRVPRFEWAAVVEAHRTGWPHMNVAIYSPDLAEEFEKQRLATLAAARCLFREEPTEQQLRLMNRSATLIGNELSEAEKQLVARQVFFEQERRRRRKLGEVLTQEELDALSLSRGDREVWREIKNTIGAKLLTFLCRAGWGVQSTGERIRDRDALAGYVVKLAANQDSAAGEVAKITQAPRVAPERFRRLRTGRKFLPPRYKSGKTGTIVKRIFEYDGTIRAQPVHTISPALVPHVAACCYHEEELAIAEMAARMKMAAEPGAHVLKELLASFVGRKLSATERGLPSLISTFSDRANRATGPPTERDTS